MFVTYRDELGLISIQIDNTYGIQFDGDKAYFTDKDGKDYGISMSLLISIAEIDWYKAE